MLAVTEVIEILGYEKKSVTYARYSFFKRQKTSYNIDILSWSA